MMQHLHIHDEEALEIDLNSVRSAEDLQILLEEKLCFPGFYGRNWNAFWDAITGLVQLPSKIRFLGWENFESRLPEDACLMRECLTDYQRELADQASKIECA